MKNNLRKSFFSSAGVFIYVAVVAWLLNHTNSLFGGGPDTFVAPLFVLMLLVLSASITGYLVLAQPIMVYLEGDKKGAKRFLFSILGWIAVFIFIVALVLVLTK
jgi:hypothetical protein